jgi:anti-sigma B factor antagonist
VEESNINIELERTNEALKISLKGRLDTNTSPLFEEKITNLEEGVKDLIINMKELEYISSAGLRVLLAAQKKMNKLGSMKVINVCDSIMEIFEITGFIDISVVE